MNHHYQLIYTGSRSSFVNSVNETLLNHLSELGISSEALKIIDESNFKEEFKANSPAFSLYFGNTKEEYNNLDIINILQSSGVPILPIVENINQFNLFIPEIIRGINGFELNKENQIESLVGHIQEGLGLLRLSRRLFISYKRDESSAVAIQLFEQLEKSGFDVFLDTHSVKKGEPFQDELWHRLADTDVVVLLNTKGFLKSEWTKEELARANSMSIGILQLIWPDHKMEREAEISIPIQLSLSDFGNEQFADSKSYLKNESVEKIVSKTESLRARSLAARQDNIVSEFISSAKKLGVKTILHPQKFLTITKSDSTEAIIIPTIGVPQAFTYNQSEELVKRIKSDEVRSIFLLYDHRNIREKWLKHLSWLDSYLPIKAIKIIGIEEWLSKV